MGTGREEVEAATTRGRDAATETFVPVDRAAVVLRGLAVVEVVDIGQQLCSRSMCWALLDALEGWGTRRYVVRGRSAVVECPGGRIFVVRAGAQRV